MSTLEGCCGMKKVVLEWCLGVPLAPSSSCLLAKIRHCGWMAFLVLEFCLYVIDGVGPPTS